MGSNIAARILETGGELHVIDNLSRTGSDKNFDWLETKGRFKFHKCDVRDRENIEKIITEVQPDVIYHLAGQVAMTTSLADPRKDFEINVLGSVNILEAVRLFSPHTIVVYSSTNKVYGDLEYLTYDETPMRYVANEYPSGFSENLQLDFHSPYGVSKGSADQYFLDYSRMFDLKTVVFRHSSMFGGRQFSTFDQGWIGWFCSQALLQKRDAAVEPFTISGNGKQVRDVLYASDMVDLYLLVSENIQKMSGNAFNIGGGMNNSLSLLELFQLLEKNLDLNTRYTKIPNRISDQKVFVADLSKIKEYSGWEPKVSAASGIESMIEWLSSN